MFRLRKPKPLGVYSHFKKSINVEELKIYLNNLDIVDKEVGKTQNTPTYIDKEIIKENNQFILILISYEVFPLNGKDKITQKFVENCQTISQIPPIIIKNFDNERQEIKTLDGYNRACFARSISCSLLAYISKKKLEKIPKQYYKIL